MDAAASQDPPTGRVKALAGSGRNHAQGRGDAHARHESRTRSPRRSAVPKRRSTGTLDGCPWSARRMRAARSWLRARLQRRPEQRAVRSADRQVRLHDPGGARFHIPDAKTETGVRVVEMSPDLAEAFVAHLDRMRRADNPTGLDDYVVQNTRGGRVGRQRIAEIIREAATLASEIRRSKVSRRSRGRLPQPAAHLHLDRAAGQQLRRQVGDEPGRPRGLEDDARRLRPTRAAHQARTWGAVRRDHPRAEEQMHGDDLSGEDVAETDPSHSASERDEDE